MLTNLVPAEQLRGIASRKAKENEYKSVRHQLVEGELTRGWVLDRKNKTTTRLRRPKEHEQRFEDRIWTVLYKMGFKHLSGHGGTNLLAAGEALTDNNRIDIVAVDDEVAFAIRCKSSDKPKKYSDLSTDIMKHVAMRERFTKVVREQLPSDNKRPSIFVIWTSRMLTGDPDIARAETQRVPIMDEGDLAYYEQLAGQIGAAARFQFLADILEGRTVPGLEITVPAIRAKMGDATGYTFSVSPEYLLKIAFVSHRARGKASDIDAYQRLLKKGRLKSIREYISDGGIFPTNIVVNIAESRWLTFDRGKQEGESKNNLFGWLHIRPAYRVAWIIDGQHRLFAYANHPLSKKSLVSVMAFVGLQPSEQARLFVDINAQQRKVKQSLLQELYAELHWDAKEPEVRVQAILSKAIQALDTDLRSPFRGRILKADDSRSETRCVSITSMFLALERAGFFILHTRRAGTVEYGPLWANDNERTMKRTITLLVGYFNAIREQATELWDKGSGEGGGLAMNDGVTVCINVLRSIFFHLQTVKRFQFGDLADNELVEAILPLTKCVGSYFASLTPDQMTQFRALRGIQGQTTGTRRVEESIRKSDPGFDPPGLKEFLERERAQTTTRAFEEIQSIEQVLQTTVLTELKSEFGGQEQDWWFNGVPTTVRKKVDDRINEEAGKKGGREQNFDLIDYRQIVLANWSLFEKSLSRGKGSKESRTKWIVEVNDLRKPVMHASRGQSLPITEEQLAILQEIRHWLDGQLAEDTVA